MPRACGLCKKEIAIDNICFSIFPEDNKLEMGTRGGKKYVICSLSKASYFSHFGQRREWGNWIPS